MERIKTLGWFTSGYGQFAVIFPYLVAAPRYFSREIQLGGLMQIGRCLRPGAELALLHRHELHWLCGHRGIADWRSVVSASAAFDAAPERDRRRGARAADRSRSSARARASPSAASISTCRMAGRCCVRSSFAVARGEALLHHRARPGSGKSTLAARDRRPLAVWARPYPARRQGMRCSCRRSPYLPLGDAARRAALPDAKTMPPGERLEGALRHGRARRVSRPSSTEWQHLGAAPVGWRAAALGFRARPARRAARSSSSTRRRRRWTRRARRSSIGCCARRRGTRRWSASGTAARCASSTIAFWRWSAPAAARKARRRASRAGPIFL